MVMEDVFGKLRSLQDILSEKIEIEKVIENIPKELVTQEELLNRLRKNYNEKSTAMESAKETLNALKASLFEAESSREKSEKNMDVISTQREYEALDKEIRDAAEREQSYRKDVAREEKGFQELEETIKRDESLIAQQEADIAQKRAEIESELKLKNDLLVKLVREEKTLVPGLDDEILFKFERIIRSKHGLGIVPVKGGVCSGCHMILPAQFVNDIHQGAKIIFCPYCSRILFYQEAENEEESYFADIESGSLSDLVDEEEDEDADSYDDDEDDAEPEGKESMGFEED